MEPVKEITAANPEELRAQADRLLQQASEYQTEADNLVSQANLLTQRAEIFTRTAEELESLANPEKVVTTGKRGRPPGSKNKTTATVTATGKRRGRPPGSKNKTTTVVVTAGKRRGRPPGSKNAVTATGKRRGRPPKTESQEPRTYNGGPVLEDCIRKLYSENPKAEWEVKDIQQGVKKLGWKPTSKNPESTIYNKLLELTNEPVYLTRVRTDDMKLVFRRAA